jgi:hypothetical protein
MPTFTRDQFRTRLNNEWLVFLDRFDRLSPPHQQEYLEKQGYARLGGLLGHIIAWWQDGAQTIQAMRANPAFPLGDYDVDAFNARAVEKFSPYSDAEVRQMYLDQCRAIIDLVSGLTDAELHQDNINTRLYYEVLSHWKEHELA